MSIDQVNWQRRQAFQIASQLPDEPEAAWAVIAFVIQLQAFSFGPPSALPAAGGADQAVLRFPTGPSSPSRRAHSRGNPSGLPK
jgi:hypothetical protein